MKRHKHRRRLWGALLSVVVLLVALSGAFRMGMWQGYRWGAMQAPSEGDGAPAPWGPGSRWGSMPHGAWGRGGRWVGPMHGGYWGRPMRGGILGRFFPLLFVLLGLGALLKIFRFKAYHMHRAHKFGPHGTWGHGPSCCGGHPEKDEASDNAEAPTEEQVAKVQPEPDAK